MHGTVEWTSTTKYVDKALADANSLPFAATNWANSDASDSTEYLNDMGDWEVDASSLGVFNTHGTTTGVAAVVAKTAVGWSDASAIYPAATVTDATISASITDTGAGLTDTFNDDSHGTSGWAGTKLTHAASAHYMIHSFVKYWSGATINWTLTNSSAMF